MGLNRIKVQIETIISNGFIKNNCIKINIKIAKPNITKNKSAFILHIIKSNITKNNRESKNSIIYAMINE